MNRQVLCGILVLAVCATLATGCGDGRPRRVKVSGRVTIDGSPMRFGQVKVLPEGQRPALGAIDEEGRFTLGSFGFDDGCVPGDHTLVIDGREVLSITKVRWHAPEKFSSPAGGLRVQIEEETDDLLIEIESGAETPFEPFEVTYAPR